MINLPKMINATGNDCLVACVSMVCMYWREERSNLQWNVPLDFNDEEWYEIYKKGLTYVRTSGMPTNNIRRFLKALKFPLTASLEFLEDAYELRNLIIKNIPPITIYDRNWFLRNVHGIGHAIVLVDQTKEMFISVDPSLAPKYIYKLSKTDFEEAWEFKKNATVIIYPKTYKVEPRTVPSRTLDHYPKEEGEKR